MKRHNDQWSRREFLNTAALAGTGAVLGLRSDALAAEPPPETTKIRLIRSAPHLSGPTVHLKNCCGARASLTCRN